MINTIRLAGVSIDESVDYNLRVERLLLENFPDEIKRTWSRIGTAEVATDPMGIELTDIFIALHPGDRWRKAETQAELVGRMEEVVDDLPGLNMIFTQPIEMRINEMVSGMRSDVGIKIFGDDFDELVRLPDEQRTDVASLANTLIPTDIGPLLPLRRLAAVMETEGPSTINRGWGRRVNR